MSRRGLRRRLCAVQSRLCWVCRVCGVARRWVWYRGGGIVGRSFHCCKRRCWRGDEAGWRVEGLVCRLGRVVVCEGWDLLRKEFLVLRDELLRLKALAQLVVVGDVGADIDVEVDFVAVIGTEMEIAISIAIACFRRPICID